MIFAAIYGPGPYECYFSCGRDVDIFDADMVVHHRDHDRTNNEADNLVPAHSRCHSSYHTSERWRKVGAAAVVDADDTDLFFEAYAPWHEPLPMKPLLSKLCDDEDISQRSLARQVGTSQALISKLVANKTSVSLDVAQHIVRVFDADLDAMFAEVGARDMRPRYRLREYVLEQDRRDVETTSKQVKVVPKA